MTTPSDSSSGSTKSLEQDILIEILDGRDNLISMSLGLNTSTPIFQTIQQTPGQKFNNIPSFYIAERRKLQRLILFKTLNAVDFHSLT